VKSSQHRVLVVVVDGRRRRASAGAATAGVGRHAGCCNCDTVRRDDDDDDDEYEDDAFDASCWSVMPSSLTIYNTTRNSDDLHLSSILYHGRTFSVQFGSC